MRLLQTVATGLERLGGERARFAKLALLAAKHARVVLRDLEEEGFDFLKSDPI